MFLLSQYPTAFILRLASDAFEDYAAMPGPHTPEDERSALQVRINRWEVKNFGYQPPERMVLGMSEELGELAEAHDEQDDDGLLDAVGDICVYAMNLAPHLRADAWTLWGSPIDIDDPHMAIRGGDAVDFFPYVYTRLGIEIGKASHAILKATQRIRGDEDKHRTEALTALARIGVWLDFLCKEYLDTELWPTVSAVAEKVMKRSWTDDPERGGQAA